MVLNWIGRLISGRLSYTGIDLVDTLNWHVYLFSAPRAHDPECGFGHCNEERAYFGV